MEFAGKITALAMYAIAVVFFVVGIITSHKKRKFDNTYNMLDNTHIRVAFLFLFVASVLRLLFMVL